MQVYLLKWPWGHTRQFSDILAQREKGALVVSQLGQRREYATFAFSSVCDVTRARGVSQLLWHAIVAMTFALPPETN